MTLTGNNAITLRKLTSKVTAEKGIPPLNQVVTEPTRNDAILDLIITNIKGLFKKPIVCSPLEKVTITLSTGHP